MTSLLSKSLKFCEIRNSRQSRAPLSCNCFAPPGAPLLLAPLGPPVLRLGPLGVLRGSCPSGSFLVVGWFPASLPLRRGWLCFLFSVAGPWPARCLSGSGGAVFVFALRRLWLFAFPCGLPLALPALRALSVRVCICSVVCFVSGFFLARILSRPFGVAKVYDLQSMLRSSQFLSSNS